jgi:lipoprotein NlpD
VLLLAGCMDPQVGVRRTQGAERINARGASANAAEHRVQKGDTLYAIAFKYALDFRDLASWNRIQEPYTIFPNQRISLVNPARSVQLEATARTSSTQINRPPPRTPPETSTTQISAIAPTPVASTQSMAADPAIAAGNSVPATAGVTVGALAPEAPLASSEALTASNATNAPGISPTNAQGLPTAFAEVDPSQSTMPAPSANQQRPISAPVATASSIGASAVTAPAVSAPAYVPEMIPDAAIPATIGAPTAGANGWGWPVQGKLISTFSSADPGRQGIDIAGPLGAAIHAAKTGEVVYSGRGIIGYGELIVIKHDDATLTAYGHNRKRLVKEGQRVTQGQQIAELGADPQGRALLHFELRRNGKPVDPLGVLPVRRH